MKVVLALATSVLAIAAALSASAQSGPSFDCGKASTTIERTICAKPELARADRAMDAAYRALVEKLSGSAKEHLAEDQRRWIASRNKACNGVIEEIALCVAQRYEARTKNLEAFGEGAYPFVSERSRFASGKIGRIRYGFDATWPQFDGKAIDFAALNRRFSGMVDKAAQETIPTARIAADDRRDQVWSYQQSFVLHRPGPNAITVAESSYSFTGGAQGYGATVPYLVDLRSGRLGGPRDVFGNGDAWLHRLVALVHDDLQKQFVEKPGFEDAIEPAKLAKLLREPDVYLYRRDRLELVFNAYVVGPYAAGPYTVEIPYTTLKPLFAPPGPLGSLR
jgi:uncharacterized protein YecT (DUF1311 family)